jgi:hypothetical protein
MYFKRLMLCLALLGSSVGFAQAAHSVPEQPEEAPPRGASIPYNYQPQSAKPAPFPVGPRILLEIVASTASGAVLSAAGLAAGELASGSGCRLELDCAPALLGMTAGLLFGTPLGAYYVGRLVGGQGSYWASVLGTFTGTVMGVVGGVVLVLVGHPKLAITSLVVGPVAGAVIAHELTYSAWQPIPQERDRSAADARFQILPLAGITPDGGILGGFAGRF